MEFLIEKTSPEAGYELIDSGAGEKLERYGQFAIIRPDPQALWPKRLPQAGWDAADAIYKREGSKGRWVKKEGMPAEWQAEFGGLTFGLELSPFKHTGLFPEQLSNWKWIAGKIIGARRPAKVLNLFGYTGGATLAAAQAGLVADSSPSGSVVVHVDASHSSIGRARENAKLSGLEHAKIRWILEDAHKFVLREVRRKAKYDAIIMDPPTYGRGAKGEMWKIEQDLLPLLNECKKLLSKDPLFFALNGYASGYSAIAYKNALEETVNQFGGSVEAGELALEDAAGKLLPAGIFARWAK